MQITRMTTLTAAVVTAAVLGTGLSHAATATERDGGARPAAVVAAATADEASKTAAEELATAGGRQMIEVFGVLDAMPESVVAKGDAAVQAYLDEHLPRTGGKASAFGWWQTAKCVGAITAAVAGGAVPVAKLLKLRAFIKKVGSVKESAYLLIRVAKGEEKLSELGATLGGLASVVLGIDQIKKHCR
ncbi:hypothetical protein ACH4F6_33805 [Streptomyces sp. NPDC017936]|uniref:hypothetical protein n=1 Tax=Streptomyces sp. NPDC017936 TaxID=3365016 RepID=UPI0037ADFC78